ncbi:MAG: hypothetical protein FJ037_01820 [Chloroflexi bacterium]|nr:hypothetical protein [Chloroflexota bacterium]
MVQITLNGQTVEASAGRRLVEVIKEQGVAITNLCYIDGLDPYAGCRTCIVDVVGARPTPLQLACVTQVADGMVVNTETAEVKRTRQSVMSLILANHPDRCLTCHRRVHCMPGDICLRDDVVTHRCLTCSKNYRCELQTSCEIVDQGDFEEPWVGEPRSYYETPPPEPDRGNPFLEYDPQMCILCTRCVRACDDLRHTGAVTLSGKGHRTMIAFGTGGSIHESDCNFCGACIDVCPTATLMEKPNKWVGRADDWTNSACNSCAVGCTISYGVADDRPVIVRPDRLNPFSRDQICVRGRFGYVAVAERERLTRSLVRAGQRLLPATFDQALTTAVDALTAVKSAHGADAIAVLGSPLATNEEAYLLARLARAIGTPHVDFSHGMVHRAVADAMRAAFSTDRVPATLTDLEQAQTVVVAALDVEDSHQVVSVRLKDAVIKRKAQVVIVSPKWTALDRWAAAIVRVAPGQEAAALQGLADGGSAPAGVDAAAWARALNVVSRGKGASAAVVYAPNGADGAARAGAAATAAANLAIALRGAEAGSAFHYLPTDANVLGIADMGIAPGAGGKSFPEIIEAAQRGEVKALVIHADNPLLNAPGRTAIEAALQGLQALVVIDSLRSTTAEYATAVLAAAPFFATDGTITNADRRVLHQRSAQRARGQQSDGVAILAALANRLGDREAPSGFTEAHEALAAATGYPTMAQVDGAPAQVRALVATSTTAKPQPAPAPTPAHSGLTLATGRSLYTSWDAASIHSDDADKLHREEAVWLNPRDAEAAGVRTGDVVDLTDGIASVRIAVKLDDGVAAGTAYVPHYYDGGALMALLPLGGAGASTAALRVRALQPA